MAHILYIFFMKGFSGEDHLGIFSMSASVGLSILDGFASDVFVVAGVSRIATFMLSVKTAEESVGK